jgi:hypothetical protein
MGLRKMDAFVKTRPDLQQKSATGGIITVVAATCATLLFLGQIYVYVLGQPHHGLTLSKSTSLPLLPIPVGHKPNPHRMADMILDARGRIGLSVHVTFPYLNCQQLDVVHDGASLKDGELERAHGKHALTLRKPTTIERRKAGDLRQTAEGCTIDGTLRPHIVAGTLQITMNQRTWAEVTGVISRHRQQSGDGGKLETAELKAALSPYNVSHYIHNIEFGRTFAQSPRPLKDHSHVIDNEYGGMAVESITVKLVPTVSTGLFFKENSYQTSVVETTIHPHTLVHHGVPYMPGLVLSYDFTPLQVDYTQGRENFFVFLSSLVSIVTGVFVTVRLVSGCLLESASHISKKID